MVKMNSRIGKKHVKLFLKYIMIDIFKVKYIAVLSSAPVCKLKHAVRNAVAQKSCRHTSVHLGIIAFFYFFNEFHNYEVLEFVSGEDLLSNYPNNIDLLFLDIQMNGLNGMDVARRIREFDNNVEIIFTTSVLDYVCEGYEVNAYRYMLKPIEYNIFKNNMGKCIENIIKKKNDFLTINDKSKLIKIKFDDILYIETSKRQLIIHTINGHEIIKMSMRKLEKLLNKDFFRCHNSFIVNLEKINKIDVSDIYINNSTIPISKHKKKQLKARLIEVLGDKLC